MATTAAERELYPLSTTDSKAIPLDVIYPQSCAKWTYAADVATPIIIPATFDIVFALASTDVLIDLVAAKTYPVAEDAELTESFILPGDTMLTLRLPKSGAARIIPLQASQPGYLYMQAVQKWAALGLKRQLALR